MPSPSATPRTQPHLSPRELRLTNAMGLWAWCMFVAALLHTFVFTIFATLSRMEALVLMVGYLLVGLGSRRSLKGKSKLLLLMGLLMVLGMGIFYACLPHATSVMASPSAWVLSGLPLLFAVLWLLPVVWRMR